MLTYGSVCSGAGTCALAFLPLGVKAAWFAEINPAASAVLAHHWPGVPNLGDMTTLPERILAREVPAPDIFMGGTPCQAFSVAGKRLSLDDLRGNLTLTFCEIANAIDTVRRADGRPPLVIFWENVPGVLSVTDNAFGCFLGGLAGAGSAVPPGNAGWSYAGLVSGPQRTAAWRVMDAQYQRVAQRRRRVFVVAGSGAFRPEAVLFESEGVRRDSAPSREAGEGPAPTVAGSARRGGGYSEDDIKAERVDRTTRRVRRQQQGGAIDVAPALNAKGGTGRNDFESEALCVTGDVTHALKAEGADGSEDGTGRGTPIIAFSGKDYGADAGEISPPLRAMGHDGSHQNGGGQVAIAFHPTQDPISSADGTTHAMGTGSKQGTATIAVALLEQGVRLYHAKNQGNSRNILLLLRQEIGEKAFAEWGLGILNSLQPQEILRPEMHGGGVRCPRFSLGSVVNDTLPREEIGSAWAVFAVRSAFCEGCSPQGWGPHEQRAIELGSYLSLLSQPGASRQVCLCDLWSASEGIGVLREALSAIQEVGRPACRQDEPAHQGYQVRRLTPRECERLMGWPDDHTAIPRGKHGKVMKDGPRYKIIGNGWALPCVRWIGKRIVNQIKKA